MGNCASAIDSLIQRRNKAASPGTSASKRTASSTTTGKLSTISTSTFMPSTVSGASIDDAYPEGQILESPNLRIFTFAELKSATKNFRPETVLGEGGFGKVYKGWVDEKTMNPSKSCTGMMVAVKKLNPESVQGMEQWQAIPWMTMSFYSCMSSWQRGAWRTTSSEHVVTPRILA